MGHVALCGLCLGMYTQISQEKREFRPPWRAMSSSRRLCRKPVSSVGKSGKGGKLSVVLGGCAREVVARGRASAIRTESKIPHYVRVLQHALSTLPPRSGLVHRTWSRSSCSWVLDPARQVGDPAAHLGDLK